MPCGEFHGLHINIQTSLSGVHISGSYIHRIKALLRSKADRGQVVVLQLSLYGSYLRQPCIVHMKMGITCIKLHSGSPHPLQGVQRIFQRVFEIGVIGRCNLFCLKVPHVYLLFSLNLNEYLSDLGSVEFSQVYILGKSALYHTVFNGQHSMIAAKQRL